MLLCKKEIVVDLGMLLTATHAVDWNMELAMDDAVRVGSPPRKPTASC